MGIYKTMKKENSNFKIICIKMPKWVGKILHPFKKKETKEE